VYKITRYRSVTGTLELECVSVPYSFDFDLGSIDLSASDSDPIDPYPFKYSSDKALLFDKLGTTVFVRVISSCISKLTSYWYTNYVANQKK